MYFKGDSEFLGLKQCAREQMVKGIAVLFEYETPKLVQISNIKIGVTQRLLQLVILIYVVCWVMIYEKGYQENDIAKSAVTTKVKGVGFTNFSHIPGIGMRSWDVADYIVPPLENNALFVITNLVKTERQSLSKCQESSWVPEAACYKDSDCKPYFISHLGNGAHTGKCIIKPGNDIGSCEIYSWCPLENDTLPLGRKSFLFPMVYNYTLLIKNDINFEKFGIHRRNIQNWASKKFLRTCLYNKTDPENRFCPIFQFGTIFEEANVDQSIFISGGVIGIDIDWKCDLDWDVQYCNPTYSFRRLDDAHAKIASGFNFR
ncbi:P2X receptor subunit (AJ703803) [Schistosoma mansoni]|uniref:P2X receptor subunit (AJ703803) n=1 Tax=Schistosoma mansoni TaxID=6183 RepID=UPI0001A6241C|nr:P2X receptor subunit (AJ703803) [Schistosoma mansoni]|eukprot:XP_018644460.1 P2X receptor subunit (AJ703803) [Schistosoma mansoni]